MRNKIFLLFRWLLLIGGMLTLQACFEEEHYGPPPGYGPTYGYGYGRHPYSNPSWHEHEEHEEEEEEHEHGDRD
jgi:hypothetical protein